MTQKKKLKSKQKKEVQELSLGATFEISTKDEDFDLKLKDMTTWQGKKGQSGTRTKGVD